MVRFFSVLVAIAVWLLLVCLIGPLAASQALNDATE